MSTTNLSGYTEDAEVMEALRKLQRHGFGGCTVDELLAQPNVSARKAELGQLRRAQANTVPLIPD